MFSRFQSFPSGRVGGPVLAALFLAALVYPGMPCSGEESPDAPGNMEVHERHVTLTPDQRMQTGVAGFREKIDAGGRIVQRMFTDADGKPCLDRNGVAGWKVDYNERGQQVRVANLAPDGKSLMMSREGIAVIQNTFDSRGYLVRCRFFGVDGQPCYATNGVAGWEADYDQRGFQTRNAYLDKDGNQLSDVNGNLLYRTPGTFYGLYDGGNATYRSQQRGGIEQYDFNVSFNIKDRLYLGVTLGAYSVDYSKYTVYGESYTNNEYYSLTSDNQIVGAGFDVKLGAIIRPFEYSPLRVGLAIHTPTFYSLDYKTRAYVESSLYDPVTGKNEAASVATENIVNGDMIREFRLQTPWLYNVSLGYTLGSSLALGAEYEYQDYSSMKFRDPQGFSDSFEYENSTTAMLKGVHTFRAGLEYKVIPQFAIRAGYNYRSALFNKDAFKDLPYNSIQTDTDFSNTQALNNYTVGIGYRGSMFYADLAYKFTSCKSEFYPFVNMNQSGNTLEIASPEVTKVTDRRSQVLLTLGVRF